MIFGFRAFPPLAVFPLLLTSFPAFGTGLPPPDPLTEGRALLDARAAQPALDRLALAAREIRNGGERARLLEAVGEAQLLAKRPAAAFEALEESLALDPLSPRAPFREFQSAVALLRLDRPKGAWARLERLEASLAGHFLLPDVRFWKGEALYRLEDYHRARETFGRILAESPDYAHADLVRYFSAWCAHRLGEHEEALAEFRALAEGAKDPVLARLSLFQAAESRLALNLPKAARETYEAYRAKYPESDLEVAARYGTAITYEMEGNADEACRRFGDLARDFPDHDLAPWASLRRGICETGRGRTGAAEEAYRRVLELSPTDPPADFAEYGLGLLDFRAGRLEEAAEHFAAAAHFKPESSLRWDALYLLTGTHYLRERYTEALASYRLLAREAPGTLAWAARLLEGWCELALGNPDLAEASFRALAQEAPDPWQARALLGAAEARFRKGDCASAEPLFAEALAAEGSPVEAEAQAGWAWCRFLAEDYEAAFSRFEKSAAAAPPGAARAEALLRAGDSLYNLSRYGEALERYRRVLADETRAPEALALDAREQIGWCRFRQRQFDSAVAQWEQLAAESAAAERRPRLAYWIAWARFRDGDYAAAARAFHRVEEEFPDHPLAAEAALRRADSLFNRKAYADAAAAYQAFLKAHPRHRLVPDALYGVQWSYEKLGRREEALGAAREFLDRFPESPFAPEIRLRLGDSLFHAGKYKAAEEAFREVLRLHPDAPEAPRALFWAGTAAVRREDRAAGAAAFRELLARWPDHPLAPEARFSLGTVCFQSKDYEEALEAYRKVALEFPNHRLAPHALFNAAMAAKELQRSSEALELFERLRSRHPKDPLAREAAIHAGILLERKGRREEALKAYREARELPEERLAVEAAFYYADLLKQMGRYDEAIREFNQLILRFPKQGEWVLTSLARIAECHEARKDWAKAAELYRRILKYTNVKKWEAAAQKRLDALAPLLTPTPGKEGRE